MMEPILSNKFFFQYSLLLWILHFFPNSFPLLDKNNHYEKKKRKINWIGLITFILFIRSAQIIQLRLFEYCR